MADNLQKEFELIRDERRTHANTATRIGNALLALLQRVDVTGIDKFLRRDVDDVAQGHITFEQGLAAGSYEHGVSGAAIDGDGVAEVETITIRANAVINGKALYGETSYIDSNGDAVLGKVSVDSVKSKGYTDSDRTLIGGKGFELYKDSNGTSHLYVDNAVIRGRLLAAETDIR